MLITRARMLQLLLLVVGLSLTSCGFFTGQAGIANDTITIRGAGSPGESNGIATKLEAHGGQQGFGIVQGKVARLDDTPMKGIIIYAAPVQTHGGERIASVDPLLDARAETDEAGSFAIANLRPGEYALATQSPVGVILPHAQSGKVITFVVSANQTTDLGLLKVGYTYPDGD